MDTLLQIIGKGSDQQVAAETHRRSRAMQLALTTECSIWLRNVVKITDPNKPFYSHRHTATSYLRNTRLPDGSPAVKEDIERYILGHAGKGAHAGYGKRWFETLKAAVEVIPNPLSGSVSEEAIPQSILILGGAVRLPSGCGDRRHRRRSAPVSSALDAAQCLSRSWMGLRK
jgi:hypothetical protein